MLVLRQLYGRGVLPSCTSISKNSPYYVPGPGEKKGGSRYPNSYVNEAILYRQMH